MKMLITAPFAAEYIAQLTPFAEVVCKGWGVTQEKLSQDQLVEELQEVDIVISEMEMLDRAVLNKVPHLKLIGSTRGTPLNVDMQAATEKNIPVIFTPGRNARAVAELTIALLINLARKVYPSARFIAENQWVPEGPMSYLEFRGLELWGKTLGLVGLGAIGRIVTKLAVAFEMQVLVYDPYVSEEAVAELGAKKVSLENLCQASDFISIHCKVTPETKGMLNDKHFELMKETAYFVNTARSEIVNEEALIKALQKGEIAGAALDVFSQEPLPLDHPLKSLSSVLLTPHTGGATHDVVTHHSEIITRDVLAFIHGKTPRYLANPQVLKQVLKEKKAGA